MKLYSGGQKYNLIGSCLQSSRRTYEVQSKFEILTGREILITIQNMQRISRTSGGRNVLIN